MSDKRTPHTDALDTLGTIIGESEARDAIHLAVEPVIAGQNLKPGQHVGFMPDRRVGVGYDPVGIVDPFLKTPVKEGERFWLLVYPGQITSLRHVWTHPAFDEANGRPRTTPMSRSERWLRNFADELDVDYDEMIMRAGRYLDRHDYWNGGDRFEGVDFPEKFWDHYENVTGRTVDEGDRWSFLTCSC